MLIYFGVDGELRSPSSILYLFCTLALHKTGNLGTEPLINQVVNRGF